MRPYIPHIVAGLIALAAGLWLANRGPDFIELNNEATRLVETGDLDAAIIMFDRAVQAAPEMAIAYSNRAACLVKLGRYADARADIETALRLTPGEPLLVNRLVELLCASPDDSVRDGPLALEIAKFVVAEVPEDACFARALMAAAYAEAGDFDKAVEWELKARECYPSTAFEGERGKRLETYQARQPLRLPYPVSE